MNTPDYDLALLVPQNMYASDARKALAAVEQAIRDLSPEAADPLALDRLVRDLANEQGIEPQSLHQLLRVALRANLASPGLYDTMAALGPEGVRQRLAAARQRLSDVAATSN